MKVWIGLSDFYPFYEVDEDALDVDMVDIPDDLYARYRAAVAELEAVVELLKPYAPN